MEKKAAYDAISVNYTRLVKTDPQKNYVQYPSALELLGSVSGLRVLDVGCGSGAFAQELLARGAEVVGYDISPEQIVNAKKALETGVINIEFIASDPREFKTEKRFDKAVSVLALHYAEDQEHLTHFFSSSCQALKDGGEFVCILANPGLKRLDVSFYNRCFRKLNHGRMVVDFLDSDQNIICSAEYSDFSMEDYEKAALEGGFKMIEWKRLKVEELGIKEMGQEYWEGFEEDCPYIGFIAYK